MGNGSFIGTLWIITFYAPKTIPVWGSPKKGKCPVKSVSEHMVLYHTVFRKIDGFSMSIINVVLKCYQSLNYILDIIWVCGLWYQTKPTGSQKSWVSHINLPVKSGFFCKRWRSRQLWPQSLLHDCFTALIATGSRKSCDVRHTMAHSSPQDISIQLGEH